MKNYKLVDKTPYHAAGLGFMGGAASAAVTPASAVVGGLIGAGVGFVAGGVMAVKDAKARNAHTALNESQFGKK